jgi:hypothetical protein
MVYTTAASNTFEPFTNESFIELVPEAEFPYTTPEEIDDDHEKKLPGIELIGVKLIV